ncbi:MAG: hypothetical protein ACYTG0_02875 [Planctomycetota bacterium]|jgi:hypothetical protein
MLPETFRLIVKNATGQTQTYNSGARVRFTYRKWKWNSSGGVDWSSEVVEDFGFGAGDSLADDAHDPGSTVDNSSDKYVGLVGILDVTTDHASSDGRFEVYLDVSTDGGTEWASDDLSDPDTNDEIKAALSLAAITQEISGADTVSAYSEY